MRRQAAALIGASLWSSGALAEPARDEFINAPPAGTYSHSDAYVLGVQESLEQRSDLEAGLSMLYLRASGTANYAFSEASANVDVRILVFTFGASAGYRYVYRDLEFAPGEDRSRQARLDKQDAGQIGTQGFPFADGRLRVVVPLDLVFLSNLLTLHWEDSHDNSFDWYHGNVHDGGTLFIYDGILFFRDRDFGAIGPYVQYMNVPHMNDAGVSQRRNEVRFGFAYGTRPGLIRPHHGNTDLIYFQLLFKPADDEYGVHSYRLPVTSIAAYRATFEL